MWRRVLLLLGPASVLCAADVPRAGGSHWSFQPLTRPAVPEGKFKAWARNPIDAFVAARLEAQGLAPSPEADRSTLLRRVSLDLVGLPPSLDEQQAFLTDTAPDAYERVVDRLLASPHFGEKWARHWLDQARYADSDGYEKDWVRPWAWRYRDWVIQALNRGMPFDRFSTWQIAGDLLPNATDESRLATGFHRNTLTNREGGISNEQFRFENTIDRAATVGTVWLGLTVGCAQCHDHKYDPISQKDFYSLFAFFDNLEEVDIDAPAPGDRGPWMRSWAEYRARREELLRAYRVDELQTAWERDLLEAAANPGRRTDWDLAWDCLLKLTEGGDGEKAIRKPAAQRTQRDRDLLTDHFVRNYHFAVGRKRYQELQFDELDRKLRGLQESYPQLGKAYVVMESPQPRPSHLRVRGDYKSLGIEVRPAPPVFLPAPAKPGRWNRLDLARWLFSPENPLTARVAVNRLWQELFAQGLVRTSEDFGVQGERPTHPELLDWLAAEYRDCGWDTKRMLRLIVTSATYRQSSHQRPELASRDPGNTLLGRQSRLRLPAELIRDSALAASGLLHRGVGGPSIRPPQPKGVAELGYANSVKWTETEGPQRYRRGLYIHFQRTTPYPLLANFDAPQSTVTTCRRRRSNTPMQALNLLNDPVFLEAAQALGTALAAEPGTFAQRVRSGYRRVLGRDPQPVELQRLERYFLDQQRILAGEPESALALSPLALPGVNRTEQAAWTGLASVLLNLDEFVTRE